MTAIRFKVFGIPAPQGSKTRMPNGAIIEGRSTGQRALHANWRSAVAAAAHDHADTAPLTGALHLHVNFRFPMPKSRSRKIRELGFSPKTSAPDLDKLIRSTGDALKAGGLIQDDALFVSVSASKFETVGWTGAVISVRTVTTAPVSAHPDARGPITVDNTGNPRLRSVEY